MEVFEFLDNENNLKRFYKLKVILWIAGYILMLVTVDRISEINTSGETTTDVNSKYGPPIIMIIIASVLGSLFLVFILWIMKKSSLKTVCGFLISLTLLTFLSFVYVLPYYTLEMFKLKQTEEDYNEVLEEIAQTYDQTIVVADENYDYSFKLMMFLSIYFIILWFMCCTCCYKIN